MLAAVWLVPTQAGIRYKLVFRLGPFYTWLRQCRSAWWRVIAYWSGFQGRVGVQGEVIPGLIWSMPRENGLTVQSAQLKHRLACWGYVFQEASKAPTEKPDIVESVGLQPGQALAQLTKDSKPSDPIRCNSEQPITFRDILNAPTPGRRVVLLGDTCNSTAIEGRSIVPILPLTLSDILYAMKASLLSQHTFEFVNMEFRELYVDQQIKIDLISLDFTDWHFTIIHVCTGFGLRGLDFGIWMTSGIWRPSCSNLDLSSSRHMRGPKCRTSVEMIGRPTELASVDVEQSNSMHLTRSWTEICAGIARGADLVSHEATFTKHMERKAWKSQHSTAAMAGDFARRIEASLLVLTHFSSRYSQISARAPPAKPSEVCPISILTDILYPCTALL